MNQNKLLILLLGAGILLLSCHTSKKEIRSEQTHRAETMKTASAIGRNTAQDSASSAAMQKQAAAVIDTITGIIYVAGNEPFTHLMLALSPDEQYLVEADSSSKAELWKAQGKKVHIVGVKKTNPMGTTIQTTSFRLFP